MHEVQQVVKFCLVTEEETRFLRNVFNFIDRDGDGNLDRDEILQILDFLGERKSALKDKEAVEQFMARLKLERVRTPPPSCRVTPGPYRRGIALCLPLLSAHRPLKRLRAVQKDSGLKFEDFMHWWTAMVGKGV